MKTNRRITLTLGCLIACLTMAPIYLSAQNDDVADAARKARADRKTAPKAKMTIDNDNLNTLTGTVSVVGQQPAPAEAATNAAAGEKTPKTVAPAEKSPVKDEAAWRQIFADANKKLADDAHELDILQREYNLKQEQFYTDPMAALKQQYSNQDLIETKTKIDEKTSAVAQDKQDISNLEDELRKAGGDPGWETPPQQPAPPQ